MISLSLKKNDNGRSNSYLNKISQTFDSSSSVSQIMFEKKNEQKQTPQSELRYKTDETLQKTNDIKNGALVGHL